MCISVHDLYSGEYVFQGTAIPDPDSVTLSIPTLDLDSQDNSLLDSTTTSVTSVSASDLALFPGNNTREQKTWFCSNRGSYPTRRTPGQCFAVILAKLAWRPKEGPWNIA